MGTTNQDVFEDSVPTDLTVSLSGPQGDSLQDASDANDDVRLGLSKLVKSLRSEVQLQKLALNKKQAAIDHLNVQQKVQLELLEQKLRLSEGDVQLLRKENETLSEQIEKLQKENLRYDYLMWWFYWSGLLAGYMKWFRNQCFILSALLLKKP